MAASTTAVFALMAAPLEGMQLQAQIRSALQAELESESTGYGHSECACIGISGGKGTINVTIGDSLVEYPSDVGSRCEAWDNDRFPGKCEAGGNPGKGNGFCAQKWCYVDPCSCEGGSPMKTTYTLDAAYKGKPLYYSYDTCGSEDTYSAALAADAEASPKKRKAEKKSMPKKDGKAPRKEHSKESQTKGEPAKETKPKEHHEKKEEETRHEVEQKVEQEKEQNKEQAAEKEEPPADANEQKNEPAKTAKKEKAANKDKPANPEEATPASKAAETAKKDGKAWTANKADEGKQWKSQEQNSIKKKAPHQDSKVAKAAKPVGTESSSNDEPSKKPSSNKVSHDHADQVSKGAWAASKDDAAGKGSKPSGNNDAKASAASKEKPAPQQTPEKKADWSQEGSRKADEASKQAQSGSESETPSASGTSERPEAQDAASPAVSDQAAPAEEAVPDAGEQQSDSETPEARDESDNEGVVEKAKKILGIDRSDDSEEKQAEDSSSDDSVQAVVEVDAQETEIEMQAMCASPVDEKLVGKNGCACVGISNQPGFMQVKIGDTSVTYPAEVGGSCAAWDKDTHPECISQDGAAVPDWCQESWCYVDPCSCNQKAQMSGKKHGYISKGNFEGRPLYYSYKACGSVDLWSAKNNEEACMNKEQESDCSGDCVWTGKKCADKVLTTVCAAQQSGAVSLRATVSLLLGAVAAVACFV